MFDLNSRITGENLIASGYKVGNSDSAPVGFLPKLVPIHLGMKTIKFSKKAIVITRLNSEEFSLVITFLKDTRVHIENWIYCMGIQKWKK